MRRYKLKRMKRVHGLHFLPCCTRLLASGGGEVNVVEAALVLDLASGEPHSRVNQRGSCYAVPPDVSRFVLGGANRHSDLAGIVWTDVPDLDGWHRQSWKKRSLPPHYIGVYGLAFDSAGKRLAVAHVRLSAVYSEMRPGLTLTDPDTGEPECSLRVSRYAYLLAFSADGGRLAATGGAESDPGVIVYDLVARGEAFLFKPPGPSTLAVNFLPGGRLGVANGDTVYVRDANGGANAEFTGHTQQVNALAVSPDGARLLSASDDGTVRAWDLRSGETVAVYDWKIGPVTALACAPDGLTCAAAGTAGQVVLWDADG